MEKTYAQALYNLSQKPEASADELVRSLTAQLTEKGRLKLLPHILREFSRLDERAREFGEILEVASEQEKTHAVHEAKELGITAHPHINHSLISGWRARKGGRVIDHSGKRALIELYENISASA